MTVNSRVVNQASLPDRGHFVVAISGGVDSVVLLHLLVHHAPQLRLRVAHFDHGLRPDSDLDRRLVQGLARVYGLPFHLERDRLLDASEDEARQARYTFLRNLIGQFKADGIMTAHHWDDRQETSVFNVKRGASRVGMAPMTPHEGERRAEAGSVIRPLLGLRKDDIIAYAKHHGLVWREDSTNSDTKITRNFIRHELLPFARKEIADFDHGYNRALSGLDRLNLHINRRFDEILGQEGRVTPKKIVVPRRLLSEMNLVTLEHFLVYLWRRLDPGAQPSPRTVTALAKLIKTAKEPKQKSLSRLLNASVAYDKVSLAFGEPKPQSLSVKRAAN